MVQSEETINGTPSRRVNQTVCREIGPLLKLTAHDRSSRRPSPSHRPTGIPRPYTFHLSSKSADRRVAALDPPRILPCFADRLYNKATYWLASTWYQLPIGPAIPWKPQRPESCWLIGRGMCTLGWQVAKCLHGMQPQYAMGVPGGYQPCQYGGLPLARSYHGSEPPLPIATSWLIRGVTPALASGEAHRLNSIVPLRNFLSPTDRVNTTDPPSLP